MFVGMITFPINASGLKTSVSETSGDKTKQEATIVPEPTLTSTPIPTMTPTPTPSPTPTIAIPEPEQNALNEDVPQDIIDLVDNYLNYHLNESVEAFKTLYYNPELVNEEMYDKRVEYTTAYHNVKCYTKKGAGEVDAVVYFTSDEELATISTYVPSCHKLFIKYDNDEPKIYILDGTEQEECREYYNSLDDAEDVLALFEDVELRLVAALDSDADLRAMIERMLSEQEESSQNGEDSSNSSDIVNENTEE